MTLINSLNLLDLVGCTAQINVSREYDFNSVDNTSEKTPN